jgi:hypothetical protein
LKAHMPKTEKDPTQHSLIGVGQQSRTRPAHCRSLGDESSPIWSLPACLSLQIILFTIIAYLRLTDTDEGLYLLAAKLVVHGKRPYLDFFFQQMPALPYVYAVWSRVAGLSWISGRMLSVLLSVALGGFLYRHIERLYSCKILACLAVLLYSLNNLVIAWHSVVKTYALSNFLLFCAYVLVVSENKRHIGWKALCGGLLLGLGVDTRLYLIVVAPVLIASLYFSGTRSDGRLKVVWPFLGGLAIGLIPNLLMLSRAPDSYIFDNVSYHLIRSDSSLRHAILQKVETLFAITNLQGSYDGSGAQFAILSLAALAAVLRRNVDSRSLFPFAMSLVLFVTCLLPSPTFPQYFCVCVPYLVIAAISLIATTAESSNCGNTRFHLMRKLGMLLAGLYVFCGVLAFYNYGFSGTGVEGIWRRSNTFDYRLSTVRQVSRELSHLVAKDDAVISFWPGYLIECGCVPQAGTENDFALFISPKLSPAEAERRKIITDARVRDLLKERQPRAVVVRSADAWGGWGITYRDVLQQNGYKLVRSIGRAEIYLQPYPDKRIGSNGTAGVPSASFF